MRTSEKTRRVVITGVGLISPLGDSPGKVHGALVRGERGLRQLELFATDGLGLQLAGEIPGFSPRDYLGQANFRPLDRTARMVASAAQLAFEASGLTPEIRAEREVGLVLGTMFCSVHTISAFDRRALVAGPSYARPFDFANSVINAAAGQTAIWHDLRGLNSTVAGGTTAGLQALAHAAEAIRGGRADALLAGGADELCFESYLGFHRAGQLAVSHNGRGVRSAPFDARRDGFYLAEGAVLLMLEEARSARARGAPILAEIRGHGNSYDPSQGRESAQSVDAVRRAIAVALADAGIVGGEIGAVSASANGGVAVDRHEALGIAAALGGGAKEVPVTAVKSMLGESLGASGGLQAMTLLESLRSGVLPGIRGLEEPEAGLGLDGARAESRDIEARYGLATAVGLDGNVATLVLERAE